MTQRNHHTAPLQFLGKDKSGVVLQLRLLWQHREASSWREDSADSSLLNPPAMPQWLDFETRLRPAVFPFRSRCLPAENRPEKQRIPMAWTLMQGLPGRCRATGAHSLSLHSTQLHRHRPAAERALPQRDQRPPSQSRRHEAWFSASIHAGHRGLIRLLLPEFEFPAGPGLQIRRGDRRQGAIYARERVRRAVSRECQSAGCLAPQQRRSGAGTARHSGGIRIRGSVHQSKKEPQVHLFHGPHWWALGFQGIFCAPGHEWKEPKKGCWQNPVWGLR